MLYATGEGTRRLFREGDDTHPGRKGKITPEAESIPEEVSILIDWYRKDYAPSPGDPWLRGIFEDDRGPKGMFGWVSMRTSMSASYERDGIEPGLLGHQRLHLPLGRSRRSFYLSRNLLTRMRDRRDNLVTSTFTLWGTAGEAASIGTIRPSAI